MDDTEIRLRCIEAAARAPIVHQDGPAAGVLAVAQSWLEWISPAEPLTFGDGGTAKSPSFKVASLF